MSDNPQPASQKAALQATLEIEQDELELSVVKENLDLIVGWISHADGKATFYLTISLVLVGASLTEIPMLVSVWKKYSICISVILSIAHLGFYGSAVLSGYAAMQVVRPRLDPDSETQSWYFFESIAKYEDAEKFRVFSNGLKNEDRINQLLDQTWNLSKVAVRKYQTIVDADKHLKRAIIVGILTVIITIILAKY